MTIQKPEFKELILLNKEAIVADGYDFEEYQKAVDAIFFNCQCIKDDEGLYCGKWENVGGGGNALDRQRWFKLRHVKRWVGYMIDDDAEGYHYSKTLRAISFNLDVERLKTIYGVRNIAKAYQEIGRFMKKNGFEHRQGSRYVSTKTLENIDVIKFNRTLYQALPFLDKCAKQIAVTNVGKTYSLIEIKKLEQTQVKEINLKTQPQKI